MPEFSGDIDIEIRAEDLKVDTYRASGAGGQHIIQPIQPYELLTYQRIQL